MWNTWAVTQSEAQHYWENRDLKLLRVPTLRGCPEMKEVCGWMSRIINKGPSFHHVLRCFGFYEQHASPSSAVLILIA